MFNQDPHEKFSQDYADFSYSAAFRQFISDNLTLGLIILAVTGIAALSNGAKGVLSHRRVGTVLLVLMVCRAFHAGATANRPRINIKDVTPEEDNDSSKDS